MFLGRRAVPGIELGTRLVAEGMVGRHNGQLAIINPGYELLSVLGPRATGRLLNVQRTTRRPLGGGAGSGGSVGGAWAMKAAPTWSASVTATSRRSRSGGGPGANSKT